MTPDFAWLRIALAGTLAGCGPAVATVDTDAVDDTGETDAPPICGDWPVLTRDEALNAEIPGRYEICGATSTGACPPAASLEVWSFLGNALGPSPEADYCGWYGENTCGPTQDVPGDCCYVLDLSILCEGRPLVVEGHARTADAAASADWGAPISVVGPGDAAAWTRAALAEHASVASFARVTLALLALGAPADLVRDTTRAQADEIEHARLCFGVARALGADVGPGALDLGGLTLLSAADLLASTIAEGCVNEAIAAAEAHEAARRCDDPAVREVLTRLADDETRHAALAWRTARWLLATNPALDAVARATFAEIARATPGFGPSAGGLDGPTRAAIARAVTSGVVAPLARTLLGAG